jgi:hypothetical protein
MTQDIQKLAEEVLRLAEKATPGEWECGDPSQHSPKMIYCNDALGSRIADLSASGALIAPEVDVANAAFIAHARTSAPALARAVREMAADIKALRDEIEAARVNADCRAADEYADGLRDGMNAASIPTPPGDSHGE